MFLKPNISHDASPKVANSDSSIHPSGYLNTRLSDGAGNGFAVRSIPFTGFPSKISSAWPIDAFYDMKHIKVGENLKFKNLIHDSKSATVT